MLWTLLGGMLVAGLANAAVSSPAAAGRAGGIVGLVSMAMSRIVDPSVPLIPNRSGTSTGTSSAAATHITAPPAGGSGPVRDYGPTGGKPLPGDPINPKTGQPVYPQA